MEFISEMNRLIYKYYKEILYVDSESEGLEMHRSLGWIFGALFNTCMRKEMMTLNSQKIPKRSSNVFRVALGVIFFLNRGWSDSLWN